MTQTGQALAALVAGLFAVAALVTADMLGVPKHRAIVDVIAVIASVVFTVLLFL